MIRLKRASEDIVTKKLRKFTDVCMVGADIAPQSRDISLHFVLVVMVEGEESSWLRMAN